MTALREAIEGADAVLFATPEYNHSLPGQLKNALDWVSRPPAESAVRNKAVGVIGASTGRFGGVWAQAELRKVLGAMGARVVQAEFTLHRADRAWSPDGRLADPAAEAALGAVMGPLSGRPRSRRLTPYGERTIFSASRLS